MILTILGAKFTPIVAHRLKELGVVFIHQLVDKEGNKMITWRQLSLAKKGNAKGRPANWFKSLESEMIEEPSCRIIKPKFGIAAPNKWRIKAHLGRLSNDARRKEWVLIDNKSLQDEKDLIVGRIMTRTCKVLQIEHWKARYQPEKQKTMLKKCKGCIYNNCNTIEGCEKKYRKHEIKGTISKYISRKDT